MHEIRENLSQYRDELKGIAMLWIVLFHMKLTATGPIGFLCGNGYGGVDLFFFLSGIGMYTSYQKIGEPLSFYKRRASRLLPAFVPVCVIWIVIQAVFKRYSASDWVRLLCGNITLLGFFANTPGMFSWYISALAASILLTPFLFRILSVENRRVPIWLCVLLFSFLLGLCFIRTSQYMAVSRLPVFILGMMTAAVRERDKPGKAVWIAGNTVALIAGFLLLAAAFRYFPAMLNDYALYWHPFVLIAPGLCVVISFLLDKLKGIAKLFSPLRLLGRASYEIFLWNIIAEYLCIVLNASQAVRVGTGLLSIGVGLLYHLFWTAGKAQK